mmetsp:Transcript_22486/g.55638  ORF Transcript_22486/g.55638 Transcript_22486/m.55638 type:complete len:256 (+) Transcript_22486:3808-4575(+)
MLLRSSTFRASGLSVNMTLSSVKCTMEALNLTAPPPIPNFCCPSAVTCCEARVTSSASSFAGARKKFWSESLFKDNQSHEVPRTGLVILRTSRICTPAKSCDLVFKSFGSFSPTWAILKSLSTMTWKGKTSFILRIERPDLFSSESGESDDDDDAVDTEAVVSVFILSISLLACGHIFSVLSISFRSFLPVKGHLLGILTALKSTTSSSSTSACTVLGESFHIWLSSTAVTLQVVNFEPSSSCLAILFIFTSTSK